jgi:DNA-binding MarR family transcriptional regulator
MTRPLLARTANVEQPTMAKLLTRMERDGQIETAPHPGDRRARQASLTRKARAAFPRGLAALAEAEGQVLRGLSKSERALLDSLLRRVLTNTEALNATSEQTCQESSP